MLLRIDVGPAAVTAVVVQAARRDDPFQRLDRRERRAGARREIAVRPADVAHHRLLEARGLAVAGEGRAIDALPGMARESLRVRALRQAGGCGARDQSGALLQETAAAFRGARRVAVRCIADCLLHVGPSRAEWGLWSDQNARQDCLDRSRAR